MEVEAIPFSELLSEVVDNRGRTCPTADEGIPLIATNCIRNELLYPTYEKARFISRDTYSSWFRGHPKPGDILFVNKATPGRVCLVPDPVDFCIAQDMVAVRANVKKVYPKYLFAALRSPIVQEQIAHMHVGTLIPHFRKGDFDKLLIPVPSPDQQQFIGDFYFNLSAKIDVNRGMNETLEAMARALFTSWFVNFDPVRAKAADLIRNRILEVGDGYRAKNSELGETGLPFIRAGNLNDGFDTDGAALLREESVAKAGSKLSCTGDVAFTSKGTIGRFARVTQHTQQFVYSPQVCYWRSLDPSRLHPITLYCWMQSEDFRTQIAAVAGQTDMAPYVSLQDQRQMSIPIFPPSQHAVASRIESLLARQSLNVVATKTLAALRDTLLPKLISGELRVAAVRGSRQHD